MGDWAMQGAASAFGPGGVGYGGVETRRHHQQDQCAQRAVAMVGATSAAEICWMNVRMSIIIFAILVAADLTA